MRIADIRADDVVLADKKGRRVFGLVTEVEEDGVRFRPLVPNSTYRSATAREIVGHWRKAGRPRPVAHTAANGNGNGSAHDAEPGQLPLSSG